jgi:hypothetical protein
MGVGDFIYEHVRRFLADTQRIQVFLHSAGNVTEVAFEMFVYGKRVARLITSPGEMNLPLSYAAVQECFADFVDSAKNAHGVSQPPVFKIPDYISSGLQYVFAKKGDSSAPIWLSLVLPYDYLPMVPWESLLQPVLQAPLLRLPHLPLKPLMPSKSLDVAICIARGTTPAFEKIARQLGSKILPRTGRTIRMYIFGDKQIYPMLESVKRLFESPRLSMTFYDLESAPAYQTARGDCDPMLQNPWLIWMQWALAKKSVDLVHFIAEGDLSREQSFLHFPQSPLKDVDPNWGSYVSVEELSLFLNQVGCWSTSFSAPADPYSAVALRMLQEGLAHLRPGPILLHDSAIDPEFSGLSAALEFLYGVRNAPPPASSALSLFCHPSGTERSFYADALSLLPTSWRATPIATQLLNWASSWSPGVQRGLDILSSKDARQDLLNSFTLASKASADLQSRENTPAWLVVTQRTLEQTLSHLSKWAILQALGEGRDAPGEGEAVARRDSLAGDSVLEEGYKSVGNDVQQGTEDALKIVADIVASHARERSSKKGLF